MSLLNDSPMMRWVAAFMAALTLLVGIIMTGPSTALAATGSTAPPTEVPNRAVQTDASPEDRGKVKIAAKTMKVIVQRNKDKINSAVRRIANALPIPNRWQKAIIATVSAERILGFLSTVTGVTDTIQGWIKRACHKLAPSWVPDWVVNRVASAISFVLV